MDGRSKILVQWSRKSCSVNGYQRLSFSTVAQDTGFENGMRAVLDIRGCSAGGVSQQDHSKLAVEANRVLQYE